MSVVPPPVHVVSGAKKPPYEGGVALCLSGGGFRAALFHLGALRRLHELGVLRRVDTICSVSGGSILAAHLARVVRDVGGWPAPSDWYEKVSKPFHAFTGKDLSTSLVLRKYLLWNLPRPGQRVRWLEAEYHAELTGGMMLSQLPSSPRFRFCATDLDSGGTWIFTHDYIGQHDTPEHRRYNGSLDSFPVARATAASSCFPPVFGPLRLRMRPSESRGVAASRRVVRLNDGGVRDNMGLEPVWERYDYVIVSDGGAPFRLSGQDMPWPLAWLRRTFAIVEQQASAIRKRWLVSEFRQKTLEGTYWGIASGLEGGAYPGTDGEPAYSRDLAEAVLSRIRTDLNAFSPAERQILENHGYMLANAGSKAWLKSLLCDPASNGARLPYPEWFGQGAEARIREALRKSHRRITLQRFLGTPFDQPLEGEA